MAEYTVKNVKTLETSDGVAFTATVYRDGKRIGTAENSGTGGPNFYWFDDPDDYGRLVAAAREEFGEGFEVEDLLIGRLVDDVLLKREWSRAARTKVLFVLDGENPRESYRYVKCPPAQRAEAIAYIHRESPGRVPSFYRAETNEWAPVKWAEA